MKRILILGAGGAPAINFARSLRMAPEKMHLVGTDGDAYRILRSEVDARYVVPMVWEADFLGVINAIIDRQRIQFIHAQNDFEVTWISAHRKELHAMTFLPDERTVTTCQNKFDSYTAWRNAGIKVPETIHIQTPEDLGRAFETLGGTIWIRATSGAAGKGSLSTHEFLAAKTWIDAHDGWGSFTASERLSDKSVTWMSLWKSGKLVVAQGRERLYWEMSHLSPTGVTGVTGAGVTVSDPEIDRVAKRAILAIDPSPQGLFGVDLCVDSNGVPNPTEINIGRFFTTHHFFTEAGVNMPYMYVQSAFGGIVPKTKRRINPLPDGLVWIRGMDRQPILSSMKKITKLQQALTSLRKKIQS